MTDQSIGERLTALGIDISLLDISESEEVTMITPKKFLGSNWASIDVAVQSLGGLWIKKGRSSHWEILRQRQETNRPVEQVRSEMNKAFPWAGSFALQKAETTLRSVDGCKQFFGEKKFSEKVGRSGFLILTNQRLIFAAKMGFLSKNYGVIYATSLEGIMSVSSGKFAFNDKLAVLEKGGQLKEWVKVGINTLVAPINEAILKRREELEAEKRKERVQIVLDFTSLKEVMEKGGLVMTTFKCPNCNAQLRLPERGKVMVCEYCGTPIKPVDIFEKIRALIE